MMVWRMGGVWSGPHGIHIRWVGPKQLFVRYWRGILDMREGGYDA
jgi:hypothetical protein